MKKIRVTLMRSVAAIAMAVGGRAEADVWSDCFAWYMGGADEVRQFKNGDMTDIRHAANASAATHGGTTLPTNTNNKKGASNLVETVYSAESGVTFYNQHTIHLQQRDMFDSSGVYKVYENEIVLPFAATTNIYTLITRMRLDETQPTNRDFVTLLDLGYNGASSDRHSFSVRYYYGTEQLGVAYNSGISTPKYAAFTNAGECVSLRGKWIELSVSLGKLESGTGRMRVGVGAEGLPRTYNCTDCTFPEGTDFPYNNTFYLGGTLRYGNASTNVYSARASYQLIAYWERVLSDDEISEAFKTQGYGASAEMSPTVLTIGSKEYGNEMMGGTITGESVTASDELQDIGKFPGVIAAGQTVNIPFTVLDTCTNLPQVVRLTAADGDSGTFAVKIDEGAVAEFALKNGETVCHQAKAGLFTEGTHTLSLTRTDSGSEAVHLKEIEISGSWRLGWVDDNHTEMGGDAGSAKLRSYYVDNLTSNGWKNVRSSVKQTATNELVTVLDAADVNSRRFTLKTCASSYPAKSYDFVISANNAEVFRKHIVDGASDRDDPIAVVFEPGTLLSGTNRFRCYTEVNAELDPAPKYTWLRLDYFTLEAGRDLHGMRLIVR